MHSLPLIDRDENGAGVFHGPRGLTARPCPAAEGRLVVPVAGPRGWSPWLRPGLSETPPCRTDTLQQRSLSRVSRVLGAVLQWPVR